MNGSLGALDAERLKGVAALARATSGISGDNDYFRQLIAAETVKSEKIFWTKTPSTPRKPNETLGADALKKKLISWQ